MGPAGIGKGSSEATRTGLATAAGAGAGTGGAGPTAAGAAVGPAMGAAEATRTGRAVGPGAGATAVTGAGTAAGGAVAAIGAGVADENMEPQNLEPNSELGLVAARSSPQVSAARWVRRCHRRHDRSPLPEPGMQRPPADRPCRRQAAGRIQRPCSPGPRQESENERPAYALIRPGLITCLDRINAVYG